MTEPVIGLCLAAFADRSFGEALDRTSRLGISVVDLPTDSVFAFSRSLPPADEVAARLEQREIRVACVSNSRDAQLLLGPHGEHTDGVRSGSASAKAAHAHRAAIEAIELAQRVGAPDVRLMLGCPDYGRWLTWSGSDIGWQDNVDAFVAAAAPIARHASEHGVRLCIEPHVKQVPFDAPSVVACLDGVRAAGAELGLCFDPANAAALGFDPIELLTATGCVPTSVHAKDIERSTSALTPPGPGWVRYGPQPAIRFRSVPWGQLDWPGILAHLRDIGFVGPLLIEHEDLTVDPEVGIHEAHRFLESHVGDAPGSQWW